MQNLAVFTVLNYPNESMFFALLDQLEAYGVGYVELGIPVKNPYMDGELIQHAHQSVLEMPLSAACLVALLKRIKERYSFRIILMTYLEGVVSLALNKLDHTLYDGIICVDSQLESEEFHHPIHLCNEDVTDAELAARVSQPSLFNYVMSGRGKTGSFTSVPTEYQATIRRIKAIAPVNKNFVGFGIKNGTDIEAVIKNGADGAIIGTEFLKRYERAGLQGITEYLQELREWQL